MVSRRFNFLAVLLALVATVLCPAASSAQKPNVVLILADDFGYENVTANGGESYRTPHIDRLAATGMRFEQCHVMPLCTPTRVQLMTGLYNVRNYIEFGTMDPKATTFAHLLKKQGYATGVCGKWQIGLEPDSPQKFGFDEAFLWWHMRRASRYSSPGFEHNGVSRDFPGKYGPRVANDFVLDFITRHRDEPFFLYYPMMLTHGPMQPTPDSAEWNPNQGERGNNPRHFPDMVAYMDKMVGEVVDKLDALGLRENTLVLFLGDNGTDVDITNTKFKGARYPGGKGRGTARGTHVPLIVNWPAHIGAGQVNRNLIASVDFLPTICEVAGADVPKKSAVDGRSFLGQLRGTPAQPREWAYFWYAPDGGATAKYEFAMTTEYKLYRDGTFFDLRNDWFEEKPLKAAALTGEQAEVAKTLEAAMDQYKNARPAHLLQPYETAKQAKKKQKKKKE